MTNGWIDIKNTDMMLIMGGNPAENHPCGFKWPIEAKLQRNAKMIVVDPRFTRTAASADLFLQIRAGADIAFLGGLINYAIENGRIAHDYVVNYTNAAFIVKEGFKLPDDGLYSGFDPSTQIYDKSTWNYQEGGNMTGHAGTEASTGTAGASAGSAANLGYAAQGPAGVNGAGTAASKPAAPAILPPNVAYDLSLQHPRSVFQLLKTQYSRYTPEMVERITGIPKDQFLKAADLFTSIRKDGDMTKAGTIIYAVGWTQHTFGTQIIRTAAMLQLLLGNVGRAGGGVNALRGHSNIQGATDMAGVFDILPGYLKMAHWLVVSEIYPDETSEFWKAPGTTGDEMKKIQTTVYRLPCAGFAEKDGNFVNSARWLQWKNVALPPPGEARLDQDILAQVFLKVRELYQKEGGKFPDPILNARWPYTQPRNPSLAEVAREINGQALADVTDPATGTVIKAGQQLPGFAFLRDDGSTLCGNWLYSGSWTEAGNMTARRGIEDPSGLGIYPNWAWSWPANRRVMYNRASCDPSGKPWDAERRQIWWNEAGGRWVGNDVPDFKVDSKPSDHMGPFIMNPEGVARIFV